MSTPSLKGPNTTTTTTPKPETTSTPKTSDTSGSSGNSSTSSTSSTPTAQETKSSQQLANAKKEEFGLSMISKTLNSALDGVKKFGEAVVNESDIRESAKKSGLDDDEVNKLTERLHGMDTEKFVSETKFLKENVLNTPNTDRALRTYTELKGMQHNNAERLQDKHIHLLTIGVAKPRVSSNSTTGHEGILGQDGAKKAADALIDMPETDYKVLNGLLDQAGKKGGKKVDGSNPDMEKVLLLKAAGAHEQTLTNPSETDRAWTLAGEPSTKMSEIAAYANDIRGEDWRKLAKQSTSIDPYSGDNALQQRWQHSCGPTTAQGMKAEIDPMYARKLHQEFIHDTSTIDKIAAEQKEALEDSDGKAVPRGDSGGRDSYLHQVLNDQVKKYTQTEYSLKDFDSVGAKIQRLDEVANKLKAGVDVPIAAQFPIKPPPETGEKTYGHFMYLTDVRGSGNTQRFLLTDPWSGTTDWITREKLMEPYTKFPNSNEKGSFYAAYY